MIRSFYISLVLLALSLSMVAQKSVQPRRTAADIAQKQTEMLVRELNITDSVLRDILFHMHLKYATLRDISNTRNEAIQRMMQMQEELKHILSPEQFAAFMNRQVEHHPRTPHHPCNLVVPHHDTASSSAHEVHDTLPQPPEHQPQDHP